MSEPIAGRADAQGRVIFAALVWGASGRQSPIICDFIFVILNALPCREVLRQYGRDKTINNRFIQWSRIGSD
ncbi:hypothetical protein [Erythrobacter sp. JK5]|uniref:hypothetical protein n=1 Tax=Erythrobacter sp. JK5 TaxID=2829500 RepID=UPI001BA9661D|nr:hypothetical protein [Erythrobacter sp. JK5]QUL37623.1 hypothetical protein KDC96_14960 [Erythrobacter sp. JK5]